MHPMNVRAMLQLAGLGAGVTGWLGAQTAGTALVRHAPTINGTVEGSVQQMLGEGVTLNGGAAVSGDLLVPGMPVVRLNGHPVFGGITDGRGSATPAGYQVTLNGGAALRHVVRRTDPLPLPTVDAPAAPAGTRNVTLNKAGQSAGDFATVRNITLNGSVGQVAVPPGNYGDITVNGASSLALGSAGASKPSSYGLQRLTLNGNARLEIVGPVALKLAAAVILNGNAGSTDHPEWLRLSVANGGVTLNGGAVLAGGVIVPDGAVIINGNSRLTGTVACDRLTVNGNGLLRLVAANQPPTVALSAPADGSTVIAFTALTLTASASDPDGTIAEVEFFNGPASLGFGSPIAGRSGEFALALLAGLPVGRYAFSARATDDRGVSTMSKPVSITVTAAPNAAPQATLMAPAAGTVLVAHSPVTLTATATDSDGAIATVEFFDGSASLGEGTPVTGQPGAFSLAATFTAAGAHTLHVRATDDDGAGTDSAPVAVNVLAALPYRADFEDAEGYCTGPLAGQLGWSVTAGAAAVDGSASFSGVRSVVLSPGAVPAEISQTFSPGPGTDVVFVDFFARPAADADVNAAATFDVEGARFAVVRNGADGELRAFNGDGAGGGQWQATGFAVPLAEGGATEDWVRLTTRLDFGRHTWDLYGNGALVAADLKFPSDGAAGLTRFEVRGHAAVATRLDDLFAAVENPLFADADRDGMDDAWEIANGLNPHLNDRDGDLDDDGLSNIREYLLGLKPNNLDTDGDGLYDGDEVVWGWGPATPNPDTIPPTPPAGLTASATTDTVSLSWQPATDNLRVSGYLVYRNGQPLESAQPVRETRFSDPNLPDNETFGYQVRAFDFAGNLSAPSNRVTVRTRAVDTDGNGLPDYWEQKYFPPGTVDPNADNDGDGITNLQEFRGGTDPLDFYNGGRPIHDVLYGGRAGPNDQLAMIVRRPDGSPWPNAPVDFDITSGRRRIAAAPGGPYRDRVTVRADAGGLAEVYLEPLPP